MNPQTPKTPQPRPVHSPTERPACLSRRLAAAEAVRSLRLAQGTR